MPPRPPNPRRPPPPPRPDPPPPPAPPASAAIREKLARGLAFRRVQVPFAVLIELLEQLRPLSHPRESARTGSSRTPPSRTAPSKARRRSETRRRKLGWLREGSAGEQRQGENNRL